MTNRSEVRKKLEDMDDEFVDGLCQALDSNSEELRRYLQDEGFIEVSGEHAEPDLTAAEAALLEVLDGLGNPKSTSEIQEIIEIEYSEKLEEYNSLKHRSWISDKLNSLAKKGYLGKYREGREVKFTADPSEAVRRWALHNNKFASELKRSDAENIATDTGMRLRTVRNAISSLESESS